MKLTELFQRIDDCYSSNTFINLSNLRSILEQYDGTDWQKYIKISKCPYNKSIIHTNAFVTVCIITWNSNSASPIHNHPEYGCIYKLLQGSIKENLYHTDLIKENCKSTICCRNTCNEFAEKYIINSTDCLVNDIGYIDDDKGLHCICNCTDDIAVSLHIYSPADYIPSFFENHS